MRTAMLIVSLALLVSGVAAAWVGVVTIEEIPPIVEPTPAAVDVDFSFTVPAGPDASSCKLRTACWGFRRVVCEPYDLVGSQRGPMCKCTLTREFCWSL